MYKPMVQIIFRYSGKIPILARAKACVANQEYFFSICNFKQGKEISLSYAPEDRMFFENNFSDILSQSKHLIALA